MRPKFYTYEDPVKQVVHYRGYTNTYQGATIASVTCKEVRKNRFQAVEDAKKLIKKLKSK